MSESKIRHSGRTSKPNARKNANMPGVRKAKEHFDREQATKLADREDRIAMALDRSPEEQLARLDRRLGAGSGATRERAKLKARIVAQGGSQSVVEGATAPAARVKLTAEQKAARKSAKLRRFLDDAAQCSNPAINPPNTAGK